MFCVIMMGTIIIIRILFISLIFCLTDGGVPVSFIFGDSLVDVGNNNYIISLSKANFYPFGIDLGDPTGRYTNSRTIVDIIGKELGRKNFTPAYLNPTTKGPVILQGVNYASGGGGILNSSGQIFVGRINLDAQIDNFANTRQDIITIIGFPAAMKLLENAIFSVTIGSNDFINNYLIPIISTAKQSLVSPDEFVGSMISRFRTQLTRLYKMGGRKIVVTNIGPIGCIPYQREVNPSAGNNCAAFPNEIAQLFNSQLKDLISELRTSLVGSNFLYADAYNIFVDIIQNYTTYGFENANSACCAIAGRYGGLLPCGPAARVCDDRSKYVFWDAYHPTEAVNVLIAKRLVDGGLNDISPNNIRSLV
ncbi:GDSL esterase/lipase At4g16230-like [Impatiens glandulifera]|uniref:GDSL esterase/lipase At4g16230-like n=1 Tax=Impatiens glandulifera TaxID=253017 RepID=UPI001FB0C975|nr:GDSL esterase/lipase At4g16230-like [Impatiens glandulifera]